LEKESPTTEELEQLARLGILRNADQAVIPAKLQELRGKLSHKAKHEPTFRFYALYDRIYRLDVLETAYRLVRRNNGAPGVDRVRFADIEATPDGPAQLVQALHQQLRSRQYRAQPVRRHYIDKPDGGRRPLGIPTISDRVVQMAVLLIIGPIFEADFLECSHGFRPGRSAGGALESIQKGLREGSRLVYDADIEAYFDTIEHQKLMAALQRRVSDRSVLQLIDQWLRAPVIEPDDPTPRRRQQGTPQGGVLSPLLANVYLHWLDKAFHRSDGPAARLGARLIRYADDFVVLMRRRAARSEAIELGNWITTILSERFGLRINPRKTRIVDLAAGERFDFLGYSFSYDADRYGRSKKYLNMQPSKRSLIRARARVHELSGSRRCFMPVVRVASEMKRYLSGWRGYFRLGYPSMAYRSLDHYVVERLRIHLKRRSQRHYKLPTGQTVYGLAKHLGLLSPPRHRECLVAK
jgi:RNA-directed DNA polymerase